jgi:hypothetical protein
MADLYILYDEAGRFIGKHYDDGPPGGFEQYATGYRKLTYAEIDSLHNEYGKYKYDEENIIQLKEIHLGVNTELFEIDGDSRISVFIKAPHNFSQEQIDEVKDEIVEVKINDQLVSIPFGDMILLNPEHTGVYSVYLSDERFYSKRNKYLISVIDVIKE